MDSFGMTRATSEKGIKIGALGDKSLDMIW